MAVLFEASLLSEKGNHTYQVSFQNESYLFTPEAGTSAFRLRREHDEWQYDGDVSRDTANQAMQSLDEYLLAQH